MACASYRPGDFAVDGSLRDVCVLDVGISEWQSLIRALAATSWGHTLELTASEPIAEPSAEAIFDRLRSDEGASARLAVRVGPVWFTSYFFDPSEIEFSFDPADISSETDFRSLKEFMTWLATVLHKRVIMTMESSTEHRTIPALLEITPSPGHAGK
jgi:hypothetical protein